MKIIAEKITKRCNDLIWFDYKEFRKKYKSIYFFVALNVFFKGNGCLKGKSKIFINFYYGDLLNYIIF